MTQDDPMIISGSITMFELNNELIRREPSKKIKKHTGCGCVSGETARWIFGCRQTEMDYLQIWFSIEVSYHLSVQKYLDPLLLWTSSCQRAFISSSHWRIYIDKVQTPSLPPFPTCVAGGIHGRGYAWQGDMLGRGVHGMGGRRDSC